MTQTINVVCQKCNSINRLPANKDLKKANCGKCKHSLLDTHPIEMTMENFDQHIRNNDIPVVVDFWASWCGPCQMMAPNFAAAAQSFPLKARFGKVTTEAEQTIAARFGIRSIPTLIIFKKGIEVDRISGTLSQTQLEQWVKSKI